MVGPQSDFVFREAESSDVPTPRTLRGDLVRRLSSAVRRPSADTPRGKPLAERLGAATSRARQRRPSQGRSFRDRADSFTLQFQFLRPGLARRRRPHWTGSDGLLPDSGSRGNPEPDPRGPVDARVPFADIAASSAAPLERIRPLDADGDSEEDVDEDAYKWAGIIDGGITPRTPRLAGKGALCRTYSHWPHLFFSQPIRKEPWQEPSPHWVQRIAMDVPRTRPEELDDEDRESLYSVLSAYAAMNDTVGYCQGMNYIAAGLLLIGFDEATALGGLHFFIDDVCPQYHSPELSGYTRDVAVLEVLVQRLLPKVHSQLELLSVPLNVIALDHFITLASRDWPLPALAQLWDLLLMEGTPALFASFLALLHLCIPSVGNTVSQEELLSGGVWFRNSTLQAADAIGCFRQDVITLVSQHVDEVLQQTRSFISLVPLELIVDLRLKLAGDAPRPGTGGA